MRSFNETLFQQVMKCGYYEAFKILLILTRDTLKDVRRSLRRATQAKGFFGLLMPQMKLMRIIKMGFREAVEMPLKPNQFDFQNLEMDCYNLPWHPAIDYDCERGSCQASGLYPSIISHIGKKFNFSVAYHIEPSGKWGDPEKLDENDSSVVNSLHDGHSAFSFSWIGTYERLTEFDHMQGIPLKMEMYMMQSGPKLSMDMVFQPFSTIAFAVVATFVGLMSILKNTFTPLRSNVGELAKFKCALALLIGLFMTVVIAFYRSAMVLALTSKQTPPFDSLMDGLADPDWSLVYIKDTEGIYKPYYKLIPEGKNKEDIILSPNYKFRIRDRVEKFQYLKNAKTFSLEDRLRASNFLRNTNCQECKDAKHFGRPEIMNAGFLFEKYSPLREVFKHGMVHMRETGALDHIKHSLGPDYIPQPHQGKLPMTIELMAMLFILLGLVTLVVCPIILALEYLMKWLTPWFESNPGIQQFQQCERIYEEGKCKSCSLKKIRQEICLK